MLFTFSIIDLKILDLFLMTGQFKYLSFLRLVLLFALALQTVFFLPFGVIFLLKSGHSVLGNRN